MQKITPFLWFDTEAEAAMNFYTSVFTHASIIGMSRYGESGPGPAGTVMTATFELEGQQFTALNGGRQFKFSEAVSFVVQCEDQTEVDYYWEKLGEGGQPGQCGWLKDKFGLSWQIVPAALGQILGDPDPAKARRAMEAMLSMDKLDLAALERARDAE